MFAQSTWTVEYTDYFSAEVSDPPNKCPEYDTKNLMFRFQYLWSFGKCRVPVHYHRSQVHLPGEVAPEMSLWVK